MFGFIGFISAAIVIALFAWTAYSAFRTVAVTHRWAFSLAFVLLAIDMLVWALCCLTDPSHLQQYMLLTDIILLAATGLAASVFTGVYTSLFVAVYPFIAGVLVVKRVYDYAPQATIKDGLLYFNLQSDAKAVTLGLLLFVWLSAVAYIAYNGMRHPLLVGLRNGVVLLFATMIFSTAILVSARRPAVLVMSFVGIVGLFAAATVVNIGVGRIYEKEGKAHATKQSRK